MSIKLSDLTEVSELKDHIGEEVSLEVGVITQEFPKM